MGDERDINISEGMINRTCPSCNNDSLMNAENVSEVYPSWKKWGATALLEDARRCCSWCKSIEMDDGSWDRLESVDQRAYDLAQAGSKSKSEYRDRLTVGELPSTEENDALADTGEDW